MRALGPALLALVAAGGCHPLTFPCHSDEFCTRGDQKGACRPSPTSKSSFCAFTDSSCDTGLRWDPTAGDGLGGDAAGQCVTGFHWTPESVMPGDSTTKNLYGVWTGGGTTVVVGALASGGSSALLRSTGGDWILDSVPGRCPLYGAWGSGASDIFAVGDCGQAVHFDGTAWRDIGIGGNTLAAVHGIDHRHVVAVGHAGGLPFLTLYNGETWSEGIAPGSGRLFGVWSHAVSGGMHIVVVGEANLIAFSDDQGITWTTASGLPTADYLGVWGTGNGQIWAVGSRGVIAHSPDDGMSWSQEAQGLTALDLHSVWGTSSSDLYAVGGNQTGDGVVLHSSDGMTWKTVDAKATSPLRSIVGDGQGAVIAVGLGGFIDRGAP